MNYKAIREELYETVLKAKDAGLIRLSAGNISVRTEDGLVAIGDSLHTAFETAYNAEVGMQTYYQALQIGKPGMITESQQDEIRRVYT